MKDRIIEAPPTEGAILKDNTIDILFSITHACSQYFHIMFGFSFFLNMILCVDAPYVFDLQTQYILFFFFSLSHPSFIDSFFSLFFFLIHFQAHAKLLIKRKHVSKKGIAYAIFLYIKNI